MQGTPSSIVSPEKMKASLEKKAQGIRTQTMTFANDGIELSLSVPDSADVREAFGSVIETVVEQQTEIGGLNTNLDKVNRDNKAARKKLVDATSQRLQQLLEHQMRLENQLQSAQREMKNFAYNIQGYVDETEEPSVQDTVAAKDIAINVKDIDDDDDISIRTGATATLYQTESGAPTEGQISFKAASIDGVAKKKKKGKKDMSGFIFYTSISKRSLPFDAKGRWKWAIKKVLLLVRTKNQKIGLSRTRMDKNQTLISRIEQMDKDLFGVPELIEKKLKSTMEALLGDISEQMRQVKEELHTVQEKAEKGAEEMQDKINAFEEMVKNMDKRLTAGLTSLEEKHEKLEVSMQNNINELRHQLKDVVALDLDRLRLGLKDLNEELTNLDKTANTSLTDLKALMVDDEEIKNQPVSQVFEHMIENNASIQQFRSTVAVTESCCDILNRNLSTLKRDVNSAHHHYNQKFLGTHSIVSRDEASRLEDVLLRSKSAEGHMKVVRDTLNVMKGLLKKHDFNLTQLSQEINGQAKEATKSFPAMKAQLEELKTRTQSLREDMNSSQEDLGRMHKTLGTIQRDTQEIFQKELGGGGGESGISGDVGKEIATLKLQMDAVRTMLFDKVKGNNTASRSRSVTPKHHPEAHSNQEQAGDVEGKNDASQAAPSVQYSDDHPEDHYDHRAHVLFADLEQKDEEKGISQEELFAAVNDLLQQLLPEYMQQYADANAAAADREAVALEQIRNDYSNKPRPKVERTDLTNQGPSKGISSPVAPNMRQINTNQTTRAEPQTAQPTPTNSVPTNSVVNAIKQVQQVFADQSPGAAGKSSANQLQVLRSPVRGKHGGSQDLSSPISRASIKKPVGGLRGSFDSAGSRVGSFAMGQDFGNDYSSLANDVTALRNDLMITKRKLDLLEEEKVTRQLVEKLCGEALAEQRRRDARTDYRSMIEDADKSLREVVHELILLKKSQEDSVSTMRDELKHAMDQTVRSAIEVITDNLRDTTVSTKALCLGCGRNSIVKSEPQRPHSPQPFFPQLSAHSLPGPDVLRGGFKLPVRMGSPAQEIPLLMKGKVSFDPKISSKSTTTASEDLSPMVSHMGPYGASGSMTDNDMEEPSYPQLDKQRPMTSGGELQSRIDPLRNNLSASASTERLRPIFRKGFPARKSLRAEMSFAPERFELGGLAPPGRPSAVGLLQIPNQLHGGLTDFSAISEEN